jgi:hypothetical protein
MHSILKLLSSPWFWLDVAFSISGGLVVWRGLIIENRAEKLMPEDDEKHNIFEKIIERQRKEIKRGWRILMTGIIMEVIAALAVSVISGLQNAELTDKAELAQKVAAQSNERAAKFALAAAKLETQLAQISNNVVKMSPENLEVYSVVADVRLRIGRPIHFREGPWGGPEYDKFPLKFDCVADLRIWSSNRVYDYDSQQFSMVSGESRGLPRYVYR